MTSKSQEPLTRPDKPIVIYSDVKAFETLHGPVLRDWPSYHIHEVIAWYAWHAPADGVRGREARVGGIEDGVWRWAQRTGRGSGGWPACARPRLSPGVLVQDSHRSPFCSNNLTEHTPQRGAACGSYVAQTALFRHITVREARDQTARQPAGHYGKRPNWANALEQPPRQAAGGRAGIRRPRPGARPHGKTQSGQRASLMARPGPGRAP